MNLIRLARFNINKHKGAAMSIAILIFFCQLFLGLAIHNLYQNKNLFTDKMRELGSIQNIYCIEENCYRDKYQAILDQDERVSRTVVQDSVFLWATNICLKSGVSNECNSVFINEADENVLENITIEKAEEAVISNMEHPIYAPYYIGQYCGYEIGDEFKITYNRQEYVFQIAGFYETTIFANANMGAIKYIISDEDYTKLMSTYGATKILGYDVVNIEDTKAVSDDFVIKAKEMSTNGNLFKAMLEVDYMTLTTIASLFPVLLAYLLLCFAIIIFVTIFIIIRHRISNSIEEQMRNIGTLGALGYTSSQITKVYMIEYSLLASIGSTIGVLVTHLLLPVVNEFSFTILGVKGKTALDLGLDVVMMLGIIGIVTLVGFSKARQVKKYPPVIAFRKGINHHHFKKNYFALKHTKTNIHLRLSIKRFIGAIKQNMVMAICITVATAAMMFSLLLYNCCSGDHNMIKKMSGMEMCDLSVSITHAIDAQEFKEELLNMDEVRKVNLTHEMINVSVENKDILSVIYPDYQEVETISTYEGRLPIYDNEVVLTGVLATLFDKEIGDSLEIEHDGYKMKYLISGITQSMINNGQSLYLTEEGMKQICPGYKSNALDIYLQEGIDKKTFMEQLETKYGKSIKNARKAETEEIADRHERIKAKAEEKIASLMDLYGVDSIDYAVVIDGEVIKGNSKQFTITQIKDMEEYMESNIGMYVNSIGLGSKVIIIVAAVIVMVIIAMLIRSYLVRQRLDLGIYKGLGYTTKELMFQITMSLVPAVLTGIILGILLAIWVSPMILSGAFSTIGVTHMLVDVKLLHVIILGLAVMGFSLLTALISTYKIKDISAYELLIE